MSHNKNISASDVASLLTGNQHTDDTEKTQEPVTKTPDVVAPKTAEPTATKVTVAPTGLSQDTKARLKDRVLDTINLNLDKYADASNSVADRTKALAKIIEGVVSKPKKEVLDNILKFFYAHRNDPALQEENALQGLMLLDKPDHYRARVFYTVMIGLARGTANQRNTSIDAIRTVFGSDDFPNWVAIKLAKRAH